MSLNHNANIIDFLKDQGKIFGLPEDPSLVPDRGLGELYFEKLKENTDKIAQIDPVTGKKDTFGEFLSRAIRVAQGLKANGICKDDVVSLCTYTNMENSVTLVACLFLGVKSINLDPQIPLHDTILLLNQVKPRIVFCQESVTQLMDDAITESGLNCEIVVFGDTQTHTPYSEFLIYRGSEEEFQPIPATSVYDTAFMHFSSGTTNTPKAVCVKHFAIYYGCRFIVANLKPIEVIINYTSPHWISSALILFWSIMYGKPRVICAKFEKETACKYIQDYKVNTTIFSTTSANIMTKNPSICDFDVSSLQNIFVGGSSLTEHTCKKFVKLFPNATMNVCYGMTEVASLALKFNKLTEALLKNKTKISVGSPMPGFTYKIVDVNTEELLGPNQRGELRVKYKGIFRAYYNNPDIYANAFDSDGFYKTGDVLYYDEDYQFYVVDRIKEMFKYKSCQISPSSIESVLFSHPDVVECVVVGIPLADMGELPTGVVVLKNCATISSEELVKFVNGRVDPRFQLDGGICIVDSFPHTTTGKINARLIRETIIKEQTQN